MKYETVFVVTECILSQQYVIVEEIYCFVVLPLLP